METPSEALFVAAGLARSGWAGLRSGLIIEAGMMTPPPMVVAMDTGYFGLKLGRGLLNGVFIGSLIPHISYEAPTSRGMPRPRSSRRPRSRRARGGSTIAAVADMIPSR